METVNYVTATRETALHLAVKNNQVDVLDVLVRLVKDYHLDLVEIINSMDEEGNTVLHLAGFRKIASQSSYCWIAITQFSTPGILEVNAVNKSGLMPQDVIIQCSCESMYSEMERLFINSGAERPHNIDQQQSADCCCFLLQIQSLQQQYLQGTLTVVYQIGKTLSIGRSTSNSKWEKANCTKSKAIICWWCLLC